MDRSMSALLGLWSMASVSLLGTAIAADRSFAKVSLGPEPILVAENSSESFRIRLA